MTTTPQSLYYFQNNQVQIVVKEGGEIWWVARDVCDILGIQNSRDVIARLCDIEKGVATVYTPGGPQEVSVINEPGLYRLIFTSRKPEAEEFKTWVFHEVLPSIRRTGSYTQDRPVPVMDLLRTEFDAAKALIESLGIKGNQAILAADKAVKRLHGRSVLEIIDMKQLPADDHHQLLTPTQMAEELRPYGVVGGARQINKLLINLEYQFLIGSTYEPTEKGEPFAVMLDTGKQHSNGTPVKQLKWKSSIIDALTAELT